MASISRAREASAMDMISEADRALLPHGGDLSAARRQFPNAEEPFVDLSTGINPHSYPIPQLSPDLFARLPQQEALEQLLAAAARFYEAPSPAHVVAAPGTQILLPAVAALAHPGRAKVLGPTYAEHLRVAQLAGHGATQVGDIAELKNADLAVVVNPNNPDGRLLTRDALISLAEALHSHGGLLVVDEAFMDVASPSESLAGEVARANVVVLRSFGKFFGLGGLRLGFALAAPEVACRLAAWLGPWAVAGPAIAIGEAALADAAWVQATRAALRRESQRFDDILAAGGLAVVGGTPLFRLVHTPAADALFHHLGRAGILVRRFPERPEWLRFGLPGSEKAWRRLFCALDAFARRARDTSACTA
jgi:cobalamin biosynthesis protein CobC